MNLLLASENSSLTAAEAIAAADLFDISANATRVALARLAAAGLIDATTRGTYRLGKAGVALGKEVSVWRHAEERVVPWNGEWIAVLTAGLPRTDRAVLRARDRALSMLGLRELESGLFIRPDNLAEGIGSVRSRLHSLGVGDDAPVFCANQFDPEREQRARQLWDVRALTRQYRAGRERLEKWLEGARRLSEGTAARDSFLLGDRAIRHLVFDPMLPAPLIDVDMRRDYRNAVIEFDRAGRTIWANFLSTARNKSPARVD